MTDFPFLSILTLAPLVGALVVGVIPRTKGELAKKVALGWSLAVLVLSVFMWIALRSAGTASSSASRTPGFPAGTPG